MKRKINLQLFAEPAPEAGTDPDQSVPKPETSAPADPNPEDSKAKYTDDDLDKIINKKFAEWQKKQQKAVDEAKKLAEMNATQKAEYERDLLQKELDALKKKDSISEMTKTARKMLLDSGISVPDDVLSMLVNTDAEETKQAVDGFAKAFKDAVESAVKERLKGKPPKKGNGAKITKEQIFKISNPVERQKMIAENMDLFN